MRKVDTEPRLACFKKIALSFFGSQHSELVHNQGLSCGTRSVCTLCPVAKQGRKVLGACSWQVTRGEATFQPCYNSET